MYDCHVIPKVSYLLAFVSLLVLCMPLLPKSSHGSHGMFIERHLAFYYGRSQTLSISISIVLRELSYTILDICLKLSFVVFKTYL